MYLYGLMVFYVADINDVEVLKQENAMEKTVLSYIQIDNYDEVLQGLTEAQRTTLIFEVNHLLDEWVHGLGALCAGYRMICMWRLWSAGPLTAFGGQIRYS